MLRLLFSTAAILPIGILSWMANGEEAVEPIVIETSYADLVSGPTMEALQDCEATDLPIFFEDGAVTPHSSEMIEQSLAIADACGTVDVTIVPVLPEYADEGDAEDSDLRVTELLDEVSDSASMVDADVALGLAKEPREEEVATLYINGRAAILEIDPGSDVE